MDSSTNPAELAPSCGALLERCSFPPAGAQVRCGVSGGPDSTALLALAVAAGCRPEAVHVDHGLRDGSTDLSAVSESCRRLGVSLVVEKVSIPDGANLEARARERRHQALGPGALLGHTADDVAETVMLHLLRGGGLDALGAMDPTNRPLLRLRRGETRAFCEEVGLPTVDDPTNHDARFTRNRVRHEVLPLLEDVADRDVAGLLARHATFARDDVALLEELAAAIDPTDAGALRDAPRALARRAVRSWLRPEMPGGYVPPARAVERVLDVAHHAAVATEVGAGVSVARSGDRLRIERSVLAGASLAAVR